VEFTQEYVLNGQNLGHVRKHLRPWIGKRPEEKPGSGPPPPKRRNSSFKSPSALSKQNKEHKQDFGKINKERLLLRKVQFNSKAMQYLRNRGISDNTINDLRFKDRICSNKYGNVCFPHYNRLGYSGCEKKGEKFNGFSEGGIRGVWFSNKPVNCNEIVICESGIDALSHAQLHNNRAQYVSIGGQLSHKHENNQIELIGKIIEKNKDKQITLAFDNDKQGKKYVDILKEKFPEQNFKIDLPAQKGQDWNDVLRNQQNQQKEQKMGGVTCSIK
jgi:5S rRNA maturation endonuclease (ribonuclease M5)